MTPDITKPTIEHLRQYLNYQYPATIGNTALNQFCESLKQKQQALVKISEFESESIWMDDRDDAASEMLDIARAASEL